MSVRNYFSMQISTHSRTTHKPLPSDAVFPIGQLVPFALVTLIFFLWGMSNNLTDILVQQFRKSFELNLLQAQLVQTSVFLAYGTIAIPAALLIRRLGYKGGIISGLCVFATGTLLFWPAAIIGRYTPFLIALFIVGAGTAILETACNPFIAEFGPESTSEQRLNFSQAFNPPGTIVGVLLGKYFIFSGVEKTPAQVDAMKAAGTYAGYLHSEILRVVPTYVGLGLVILVLAAILFRTRFQSSASSIADAGPEHAHQRNLFQIIARYPQLRLAIIAQFFYVGAQVGTWSNFIPYMKAYTVVSERDAANYLIGTLVALAAGRILSTPLMRLIAPDRLLTLYAVINVILCVVGVAAPGLIGTWALLLSSFFMSIMFPTIFALGLKGLGADTKLGGSLIVMAILGGALLPLVMGAINDRTGKLALAYLVPVVAYAIVAVYAFFAPRLSAQTVRMALVEP
jgi:FHS family L-fucose permease-like MFS transporter